MGVIKVVVLAQPPRVVIPLLKAHFMMLQRNLLYTAITRAKDRVTVVGGESAIRGAIERPIARASGLRHRLWPEA